MFQRESADLAQQIESLQNKLEESNAATLKALQENQHLQQENENAVAKLNGAYWTLQLMIA